jgi:hypothetical protein
MANHESTYKCVACVEKPRSVRDGNTPVRSHKSTLISEIGKKTVVLDRELILPALKAKDSLSIQQETV